MVLKLQLVCTYLPKKFSFVFTPQKIVLTLYNVFQHRDVQLVHWEDVMIHVGNIISTSGRFSRLEGYHEYFGWIA